MFKKINMYPEEIVKPMRQELVNAGFKELHSADEVDNILQENGTTLIVVNSVCGCAAGTARPGTILSLQGDKKPMNITTVFAGVDAEAVAKAREHMIPFPPSSPAVALFKDGEFVQMLERHHIEGRSAEMIAENLSEAYQDFC